MKVKSALKLSKRKSALIALIVIVTTLAAFSAVFVGVRYGTAAAVFKKEFLGCEGEIKAPSGDFIQPWMCEGWELSDFENHLDKLAEAGYDTVLWQYTVVSAACSANIYYPASADIASGYKTVYTDNDFLTERLLEAAENKGFAVFLGLANDDDWWKLKSMYSTEYHLAKAERDNKIADELYSLYKSRFPNAFYGWYWSWELWTNPIGLEKDWARMLNKTIAHISELSPDMPLLFSPFVSKFVRLPGGATERMWTRFFRAVNFRPGDIFAPQDSIGKISFTGVEKDALAATLRFLTSCNEGKKANPNVKMWVNCELFSSKNIFTPEGGFYTADLERIKMQLMAASRFAEKIITFSYSHFCLPDAPNNTRDNKEEFHSQYIEMISGF
ncbi:MAG TPA: DUF4434 domain-containing protein [Clostridia bacterium]|nr:DUF4434 domain-containing protein [Clostridia bacterium]